MDYATKIKPYAPYYIKYQNLNFENLVLFFRYLKVDEIIYDQLTDIEIGQWNSLKVYLNWNTNKYHKNHFQTPPY